VAGPSLSGRPAALPRQKGVALSPTVAAGGLLTVPFGLALFRRRRAVG
jgi:hypothetical protein